MRLTWLWLLLIASASPASAQPCGFTQTDCPACTIDGLAFDHASAASTYAGDGYSKLTCYYGDPRSGDSVDLSVTCQAPRAGEPPAEARGPFGRRRNRCVAGLNDQMACSDTLDLGRFQVQISTQMKVGYSEPAMARRRAAALECAGRFAPRDPSLIDLKLAVDGHPLAHIVVASASGETTTDANGVARVSKDGDVAVRFVYRDSADRFRIYVVDDTAPAGLTLRLAEGVVQEGRFVTGGGNGLEMQTGTPAGGLDLANETFEEIYTTARRYVHLTEALDFYRELGVDLATPVDVVTYVDYPMRASYHARKIVIDRDIGARHEYFPFVEYHEFAHFAMHSLYGPLFEEMSQERNHGGFANPTTGDSWLEGFAAFMALATANRYDRWWTKAPLRKRAAFYPMAGSLDADYKAWDREGLAEEFAIAGVLWDVVDATSSSFDVYLQAQVAFQLYFTSWDVNEDDVLSLGEIHAGSLLTEYSTVVEGDSLNPWDLIQLSNDMLDLYQVEPDMTILERYGAGEALDGDALEALARDLVRTDEYLLRKTWLESYDEDGDGRVAGEEARRLIKGLAIMEEFRKFDADDDWQIDGEELRALSLQPPFDTLVPLIAGDLYRENLSLEEFVRLVDRSAEDKDDDGLSLPFETLWDVISRPHRDFASVVQALADAGLSDEQREALGWILVAHGAWRDGNPGDGIYNDGEAYVDANANSVYDPGETFIDYPFAWALGEDEETEVGTPSNYQRLERLSSPEFRGQFIEAHGRTELVFLMMDGIRVREAFGYSADADGRLYVPVPPGARIFIKDERREVSFTSRAFDANYERILRSGSIDVMLGGRSAAGGAASEFGWAAALVAVVLLGGVTFTVVRRRRRPRAA